MSKKSPPAVQKPNGKKQRPKKEAPNLEVVLSPSELETVQYAVNRLLVAYSATPKFSSPDPAGFWGFSPYFDPILGPTFAAMVGIKTNKTAVAHRITILDLTNPALIIPPKVIPGPVPAAFWAHVGVGALVQGHDYRLRVEIDPPAAMPGDEFDTVYVTLV